LGPFFYDVNRNFISNEAEVVRKGDGEAAGKLASAAGGLFRGTASRCSDCLTG